MNKISKGIAYVSSWIIGWGIIGSIIDKGFIQVNLIEPGQKSELIIFFTCAILCFIGGFSLYEEVFNEGLNK